MTETISPAAQAALDRYTQRQYGDLSDISHLADTMYRAGWQACFTEMITFQDFPAMIRRIEDRVRHIGDMVDEYVGRGDA